MLSTKNIMTKRRYSSEDLFNLELCILCQCETNETLACPANIKRKDHNPIKTYSSVLKTITRFTELEELPFEKVHLPIEYIEGSLTVFIENGAKFHKTKSVI